MGSNTSLVSFATDSPLSHCIISKLTRQFTAYHHYRSSSTCFKTTGAPANYVLPLTRASGKAPTFEIVSELSLSPREWTSSPVETRGIKYLTTAFCALTLTAFAFSPHSKLAVAEGAVYSHLGSIVCARAARSCHGSVVSHRFEENDYIPDGRRSFVHLDGLTCVPGGWSTVVPQASASGLSTNGGLY